jgi:hypothetical protein
MLPCSGRYSFWMEADQTVIETSEAGGDLVLQAADTLESRVDAIADEMLAAYKERIESYAEASDEVIEDAREWASGSVMVATGIVRGELSASDFYEALRDVGRRRAEQGFPLHDVLLANLVATEILWSKVMALAPDDPAAKVELQNTFVRASVLLLQQAVTGLSAGYLEVEEARVADEEHDMQVLVEALAGLRKPDRRHEERAERRGIELTSLRWCGVMRIDGDVGHQVRMLRRHWPTAPIGRVGSKVIAFLPGEAPPDLDVAPVGLASVVDPSAAYGRASAALEVAIHLDRPRALYEEVVPLAMVLAGPQEDRRAFVNSQLGPLLKDPLGTELLKSLQAFYGAGQSVAAAARDLYIHRHTLEYRLSRIEEALGRDIRASHTRMLLELALTLTD